MKRFVTVLQISASKFDVLFFTGNTQISIFPLYRKFGIAITIWESNTNNDKYCFQLADKLNLK
jgi:hypothetical protein